MANHGAQAVDAVGELLREILQRVEMVKQTNKVGSALKKTDLGEFYAKVEPIFPSTLSQEVKKRSQYAVIETAVRDTFNNILASTSIDAPSSVKLWNLLDIIAILSDDEQCDPALLFWLVEELLDSQTISGCRKIFDYLESRRERITAKHFPQKQLVILRSCNELLRRLSRAEDTAFCGRVFIFLFQSFPLGDKSSVNLRGEFHTENVTSFDEVPPRELDIESMDVDSDAKKTPIPTLKVPDTAASASKVGEGTNSSAKGSFSSKPAMSVDELYPVFWSLQQSFSQPKRLFDKEHFATFKSGLESTMVMFNHVQSETHGRTTKSIDENKRGVKRKRGQGDDDLANAFNPKYLTSRDLFELEISDLSFRRHILLQTLIIIEFLLSLSPKSREKLSKSTLPDNPNKSVMYADQSLSEEDTKWALDMKKSIAEYLRQGGEGNEGPFFYRMVDSVLSRDKNWVRWKIENCPTITKPAVTPEEYNSAKNAARKATTNKRLRANPLGSLDLKFLAEGDGQATLERLKDPSRYQIPQVKSFRSKIELDDMDIEMAREDEEKTRAIEAKASKSWRALRIASTSKLVAFDKLERSDKIDEVFVDEVKIEEPTLNTEEGSQDSEELVYPKDRRPIVITGPSGVGKSTLIKKLVEKHSKVMGRNALHTTRPSREGEVQGQHYFFVTKDSYNTMRDGDEFLEYSNYNGDDYGTSRKVVEGIIAQGKVPVMEMEYQGIEQVKEKGFSARFIFIAPTEISQLESRLEQRDSDDEEKIKGRLEIAEKELEHSKIDGVHDKIFVNDVLEDTFKALESYIFGADEEMADTTFSESKATPSNTDIEMIKTNGSSGEAVPSG
ncbi:guanylate kinase [Tricladium varicosporioides]|nr:guanylate kinase [Hymenoscyphus varicosporioides]